MSLKDREIDENGFAIIEPQTAGTHLFSVLIPDS